MSEEIIKNQEGYEEIAVPVKKFTEYQRFKRTQNGKVEYFIKKRVRYDNGVTEPYENFRGPIYTREALEKEFQALRPTVETIEEKS